MVVSENVLKWVLRLYPPLLFQRIWVIRFEKGFRGAKVKINRSLINSNYNHSIFGGTIFAGADIPFYPLLFHQVFNHKGYKVQVWMKSAEIKYLKPGRRDLFFSISLTDADIEEAEQLLNANGKHIKAYLTEMCDKDGLLCVEVMSEIYIRNLEHTETKSSVSI